MTLEYPGIVASFLSSVGIADVSPPTLPFAVHSPTIPLHGNQILRHFVARADFRPWRDDAVVSDPPVVCMSCTRWHNFVSSGGISLKQMGGFVVIRTAGPIDLGATASEYIYSRIAIAQGFSLMKNPFGGSGFETRQLWFRCSPFSFLTFHSVSPYCTFVWQFCRKFPLSVCF